MATEAPPQPTDRRSSLANLETAAADVPEFLRIKEACRRFSVSRSWLYQAIVDKRVESFSVRDKSKIRGVRLIETASLRALIRAQSELV